jgi:glycosyltransferase involved in cell wall biosynthesis
VTADPQSLPPPDPSVAKHGWPWECDTTRQVEMAETELPRITVVTPSYNQGQFLEETIRSVLLQGYSNLEYIVVDGGSSDNSGEILAKYANHISHVISEPDAGQSDAICKGLRLATGKFFNWINSDDLLLPGILHDVARNFHHSIDLYTCNVRACGETIEPYTMHNRRLSAKAILRADRYSFSQPGLWFLTQAIRDCGGIDSNFNYGFDWDLLVRYLSLYPRVHYASIDGAAFRLHPQSKTVSESNRSDQLENRFHRENLAIREKLEKILPHALRQASLLGRERVPWNERLTELLDEPRCSPISTSLTIMMESMQNPRARFSMRTLGSVARLMSRYFRPRFYRGKFHG